MFVLNEERIVAWPVRVRVQLDGGRFETREFTARFRLLGHDRMRAIVESGEAGRIDETTLREALAGWDGVAEENGTPIAFSVEARDRLLDIVSVRKALIDAYFEALGGAREKN